MPRSIRNAASTRCMRSSNAPLRSSRAPKRRSHSSTSSSTSPPSRPYLDGIGDTVRTGRSAAAALRNSRRDPGPARRCGGGDDLGAGASGRGRLGRGGDQHGTPPTTVQRQRERGGVVAVESVCDGWVCDTDPTLRSRPPHGMGPSRPHRRTQRCTSVWPSQPVEEHRLPRPPRRPRVLAHLPTRRNRNQLTARAHCDTPSSGSGV